MQIWIVSGERRANMMIPLILLFLTQSTSSLSTTREYHFVNLKKTWWEAQAYCREHFVDLATMETEEDWARVQGMVVDSGHSLIWMGLYDDMDGWRWSVDGAPLDHAEIASLPQVFNDHKSERHCVSWWKDTLQDSDCDSAFYSVCFDEPSGSYVPVTVPMTWESAQQHCRGAHTDLTRVRGLQEKERVSSVVDAQSHWWIGLSRGPRKWSDGSNSSLRVWDGIQPYGSNQDCGCLLPSGWHDCVCSWKGTFICSVPIWTAFEVQLRTDGSAELNEAQIRDGVGMQIKKHFREWRIRQDFKLKWKKQPNGEFLSKNVT